MPRLTPILMGCLLLAGCSSAPSDASKQDDPKTTAKGDEPAAKTGAPARGAAAAAFDYLASSYKGSEVELLSAKEHPVTTAKTVGTALAVEWRLKGSGERQHQILLVQSDKVVSFLPYDPGKSLEANAAALVKQFEN